MFAVLSDIHANLEAMEAVITDLKARGIEDVFFLGDCVGYGPDPEAVVEIIQSICKISVQGNHDRAIVEPGLEQFFNDPARDALIWTRGVLSESTKKILKTLPLKANIRYGKDDILFVHASPRAPEEWEYIFTLRDAEINFYYFNERFCFVGHSHYPFVVERSDSGQIAVRTERPCRIRSNCRYIINAGSVGQPRDGDPRACYVIFNGVSIEFIRVHYDIKTTQKKMKAAGLPASLINRLEKGV